jgi:hypothetical protein
MKPLIDRRLSDRPAVPWAALRVAYAAASNAGATFTARSRARNRLLWWLTAAASGALLFLAYLGQARTAPTNSDGATNLLQAQDMLHGNLLLHGWVMSDVSFYTTELPQYMLVELVRGINSDTVHVAAAMTYTLVVVLAALLARGRATGMEATVRMLIATGILLAPPLGLATNVLLSSPDHIGTQVPLLLTWLVLDRARPRWYVPVVVGVLLTLVQLADAVAIVEGALPLAFVCMVQVLRQRGALRERWYEISLAGAAVASYVAACLAGLLIRWAGGFIVSAPPRGVASSSDSFVHHVAHAVRGVLLLFGVNVRGWPLAGLGNGTAGQHAIVIISAVVHLVGVALVVVALVVAVRRSFTGDELVVSLLTVAIVGLSVTFALSTRSAKVPGVREISGILPAGAVLTGRLLAARVTAWRLVPLLSAVMAGYLLVLGAHASRPTAVSGNQRVAAWLVAHHLRYGLAQYWWSSVMSVDSRGQSLVRPVRPRADGKVNYYGWEWDAAWYQSRFDAQFVVYRIGDRSITVAQIRATFGRPAVTYRLPHYRVFVWHKNLLRELPPAPKRWRAAPWWW